MLVGSTTEVFRGFPESHQKNVAIVPPLDYELFLPNTLQFMSNLSYLVTVCRKINQSKQKQQIQP